MNFSIFILCFLIVIVSGQSTIRPDSEYESGQSIAAYPGHEDMAMHHWSGAHVDMSFADMLQLWKETHPVEYADWVATTRQRYAGGYWLDPTYVNRCAPPAPTYPRNPFNQTYGDNPGTYVPPTQSSTGASSSTGVSPTGYVPLNARRSLKAVIGDVVTVPKIISNVITNPSGYVVYGPPYSQYQGPAPVWPAPEYLPSYEPYVPIPPPPTTYPVDSVCPRPPYENECEATYLPNGLSIYGYDEQGYDPQGYDMSGYDRNGWSRYGREGNTQYNSLGELAAEEYKDLRVKFDRYGKPITTSTGEILRYDSFGYDQYGYDKAGNPRRDPTIPECGVRPIPPPRYTPPEDSGTVLGCETQSEIMENGARIYLRKSANAMTPDDWQRFRSAWNKINDQGLIAAYTRVHTQTFQQHGSNKFLPWHRELLARFENDLHSADHCVFFPYWDVVALPSFPAGIATTDNPVFPPAVRNITAGTSTPVTRSIGAGGNLPNAGMLSFVTAATTYTTFNQRLEQWHNAVHVYVGGDMAFISRAPNDPAFWLHHSNIDKIWHDWQQTHTAEPAAAVITDTINPLQFGENDSKLYASQANIAQVATGGGAGYRYL